MKSIADYNDLIDMDVYKAQRGQVPKEYIPNGESYNQSSSQSTPIGPGTQNFNMVNTIIGKLPKDPSQYFNSELSKQLLDSAVGSPAIKMVGKAAPAIINTLQPRRHAEELVQKLSGGKSIEDIGESLAQRVKNGYEDVLKTGKQKYESFLKSNRVSSDAQILDRRSPIEGFAQPGKYESLEIDSSKIPDSNVQKLHDIFMRKPTFDNAHRLQSELASEQRYLKNLKEKTSDQKNWMNTYGEMRTNLKADMDSFLEKLGGVNLKNQYKEIGQYWKNNIIPYKSDKQLMKIVEGVEDNPTRESLISIFKNPNKDMRKVLGHVGDEAKDEISYLGMGLHPEEITPKSVMQKARGLDKQGLGSYKNPELIESLKKLNTKNTITDITKSIVGAGIGFGVGSFGGEAGEILGALLGGKFASVAGKATDLIPREKISTALKNRSK